MYRIRQFFPAVFWIGLLVVACSDSDGDGTAAASDAGSGDSSSSDATLGDLAGGDGGVADDTANGSDGVGEPGSTFWPAELTCDASAARCDGLSGDRPGRLSEHAAAYDYNREEMLVFGGSIAVPLNCGFPAAAFVSDTWIYDVPCGRWTAVQGEAPPPRGRHMLAYGDGSYWMLGGRFRAEGSESGAYTVYDDLWRFHAEGRTWESVAIAGGAPEGRMNGGLAWDIRRGILWLIGGNTSASGAFYAPLNDVWRFDPAQATWSEEVLDGGPDPRLFHTVLYDYKRDRLVLSGGADESAFSASAAYFRDVWALELDPLRWVELHDGEGTAPEGRFWGRWVHATDRDTYLLFAGHDDQTLGNRNDVWEFLPDENTWQRLAEGDTFNAPADDFCDFPPDFTIIDPALPERRNAHTMVWSPSCGRAVAFAGKTDCGVTNDVWEVSDGQWTERLEAEVGEVCHRFRANPANCQSLCL